MAESRIKKHLQYSIFRIKDFFSAFWKTILLWIVIIFMVILGLSFHVDKKVLGVVIIFISIITQAFAGLLNIIVLIPFIGPILAKLLALPLFWLFNSLGYFASLVAIRKGYKKQVLNYRILTLVLLTGIVLGYILGKIF